MRFKEGSIHKENEKKIQLAGLARGKVSPALIQHLTESPMSQQEIQKTIDDLTKKDK